MGVSRCCGRNRNDRHHQFFNHVWHCPKFGPFCIQSADLAQLFTTIIYKLHLLTRVPEYSQSRDTHSRVLVHVHLLSWMLGWEGIHALVFPFLHSYYSIICIGFSYVPGLSALTWKQGSSSMLTAQVLAHFWNQIHTETPVSVFAFIFPLPVLTWFMHPLPIRSGGARCPVLGTPIGRSGSSRTWES